MPLPSVRRCALSCLIALAVPSAVHAAPAFTPAERAIARASAVASASGTITALNGPWLTIQTSGRRAGVMNAMIAAADRLTRADYAYVWGGGHPAAGTPTRSGRKIGFDCSGSVAAVLVAGGLWPAGSPVPNDAGVIAQLRQEGLIARGVGRAPRDVTLFDDPGYHIFMRINGRYFGTSDGGGGGTPKGGPGWLYDGAPDAHSRGYHPYHLATSVLRDRATYGHMLTFQASDPALLQGFRPGDAVTVTYAAGSAGALFATGVSYTGAVTTVATLVSVGPGTTIVVQTPAGQTLTLALGDGVAAGSLAPGHTLQIVYTHTGSSLVARQVTDLGPTTPPAAASAAGNAS